VTDAHSAWHLRSPVAADAPGIAAIHRESFTAALPFIPTLHTSDDDLAFFRAAAESQQTLLADAQGETQELAGFAMWTAGWLNHLYVAPRFQRRGLGSALLDAVRDWHVTSGLQVIDLWTFQRNAVARRFYQMQGFVPIEFTDGSGNEEQEPDIRFRWRAAPSSIST